MHSAHNFSDQNVWTFFNDVVGKNLILGKVIRYWAITRVYLIPVGCWGQILWSLRNAVSIVGRVYISFTVFYSISMWETLRCGTRFGLIATHFKKNWSIRSVKPNPLWIWLSEWELQKKSNWIFWNPFVYWLQRGLEYFSSKGAISSWGPLLI